MLQFPELFEQRTNELLGDEYFLLKEALNTTAPVSIRFNTRPNTCPSSSHKVPWSLQGFYLESRPVFTIDPLLHAGAYYVQEASSMFLEEVVRQLAPNALCALDLCAAPGGKSTLLSALLPYNALLVSNEIVRSRAMILTENIVKWGNPNCVVTNNAPADFQKTPNFFDLMVVDAPCSGEGMFRKDPGAIGEWSLSNVEQCATRQKNIVADAWDALKEGGILIYSTCTYNREENENTVEYICKDLGAEFLPVDIKSFEGIVSSDSGYRFYPHRISGEGFFIAAMRKTAYSAGVLRLKTDLRKLKLKESMLMNNVLISSDDFFVYDDEQYLFALPRRWKDEMLFMRGMFNCLINGILLAERKGKDLIPAHQLALSKLLNRATFSIVEVELSTALKFLKRESIQTDDAPVGYVLISYQKQILGWVKNLGNRSNNLYPQHWRIRMNV